MEAVSENNVNLMHEYYTMIWTKITADEYFWSYLKIDLSFVLKIGIF